MAVTDSEIRELVARLPEDPAAEARLHQWIDTADTRSRPAALVLTKPPRRRLAVVLSAAAMVLLVCAIAFIGNQTRSHDRNGPVGVPTTSSPEPSPTVTGGTTLTPQVIVQYLMDLLPKRGTWGGFSGSVRDTNLNATTQFDDGRGAVQISVGALLWYGPQGDLASRVNELSSCANFQNLDIITCTTASDGTEIGAWRKPFPGFEMVTYRMIRPDGFQLEIDQFNTPTVPLTTSTGSSASATRADLPFSTDEMLKVLTNARWNRTVPAADAARADHLFTLRVDPTTITGLAVLPDVRGMQAGDAIRALLAAGFRNFENTLTDGGGTPAGQVLTMNPTPGNAIDVATKIIITSAAP